ncbi:MAG: 5-(carboxyamino)imidazole ribonucleotide synthase [Fluviicola sp.]|nr:MAG: 5-(carboxyamino)imidazole ribonucleotide synthase [Fluviicola sp.]
MKNLWYGNSFKLGVLGGGQLGRMLIQSAMNYDIHIYAMDSALSAPCGKLAHEFTIGDINDFGDVLDFGKDKDVLTVEIEHVNVDALEELENSGVKVFPQPRVLRLIQDKGLQKEFYKENNIPTAPYKLISNKKELESAIDFLPAMQKLRKGGYDGKGVYKINDERDIVNGFEAPSLLEELVDFDKELSVIVARNEKGEVKSFPLVECEFSPTLNLVEFLFSPASVSSEIEQSAQKIAKDVIEKLDMVGLLAVELFLTKDGDLLVNEVAPRTHNSGHHTIECNYTSQFEQHLRAITNQSLGDTSLKTPGVMVNLLGEKNFFGSAIYDGLDKVIQHKGVYVHLYGKAETKPHRKMGHATILNESIEKAKENARMVQKAIKIIAKK